MSQLQVTGRPISSLLIILPLLKHVILHYYTSYLYFKNILYTLSSGKGYPVFYINPTSSFNCYTLLDTSTSFITLGSDTEI